MSEVQSIPNEATRAVDSYIASWNEFDAGRRRAIIAEAWAENGRYVDPHTSAAGREAIDAMIGEAQGGFPDHSIRLAHGPDAYNDRARFIWHLVGPDGGDEPVAVGMDVATLTPDGRISEVVGFRGSLG
ncbi:MAG: nuclear transport factor 2 family protein [Solirubrobacteraceae bacterium]